MNLPKLTYCGFVFALLSSLASADDWPQFRGPTGQGESTSMTAPLTWAVDSENLAWKVDIEGLGWSSPVILDDKVWLTTATGEGRSLRAICVDRETGEQRHNVEVFRRKKPLGIHRKNSHASPTPVLEGDRVYVHFGTSGTACLTSEGKVIWRRELAYRHVHGPGGSPILFENKLIFSCDGGDKQFVIALDKTTGETIWQTERPENPAGRKFAFSTPLAIHVNGQWQIVSAGAGSVCGYEPASGKQIWQVDYPGGYSVVPRPVFGEGMVFVSSSYDRPTLFAINPSGQGNLTESHVDWTLNRGAPHNPSPVMVDGRLYVISDRGIATCVDATSGKVHWQERIGGNFSASLVAAAGRVYLLDEKGKTTVISTQGKEFKVLAENDLASQTLATPAIVDGALYLRTETALFKFTTKD